MVDEDLVQLRQSLAMAPRLPPHEIERLLDEVQALRSLRRDLAAELDELAARIAAARARTEVDPSGED